MPEASVAPVSFRPPATLDGDPTPSALPREFLRDVRTRVRLLALFMLAAFGFDLVIFAGKVMAGALGIDVTGAIDPPVLQWANAGVVVISALLWGAARAPSISERQLHLFGLAYEVTICFVIAAITTWQFHHEYGVLPNLTWVPAIIILFPLVLPGTPRRMLAAAVVAGAMAPLALLVLHVFGAVPADADAYLKAAIPSLFAVGFANMGARIVYGLGREVVAAREMGSYQLEHKLGEGGMGEVWQARHRLLARPAAVKLIRPSVATGGASGMSEETIRRFEREAQATAQLRSPHTVELFDYGVATDGTIYYVMELLDGLDADSLVRRFGPVPVERAVHLLGQVCHSLSEAEARGLVHRDIKPANIFVCRYGEDLDFVKVLDFGLVKALGGMSAATETVAALTREDVIAGTPAFMAPEQAMGLADLDSRADIYSFGCVAYWLLTGQHVFSAPGALGQVAQHATQAPTAPSSRTSRHVPSEVDGLILACLAKAPEDRPTSWRRLSGDLHRLQTAYPWSADRARECWEETAAAALARPAPAH